MLEPNILYFGFLIQQMASKNNPTTRVGLIRLELGFRFDKGCKDTSKSTHTYKKVLPFSYVVMSRNNGVKISSILCCMKSMLKRVS